MTLEEAIEHCKEAEIKECKLGNINCANEHRQLHDWLVELKELKGNAKENDDRRTKRSS